MCWVYTSVFHFRIENDRFKKFPKLSPKTLEISPNSSMLELLRKENTGEHTESKRFVVCMQQTGKCRACMSGHIKIFYKARWGGTTSGSDSKMVVESRKNLPLHCCAALVFML